VITITRKSQLTGRVSSMEIPMNQQEFDLGVIDWTRGALIQEAFPSLSPDMREFILTGITAEEWDDAFGHL
jgi:hypothetical protein